MPFMPSSSRPVIIARVALAVSVLVGTFFMVGPFQGLEEAFVPWDKAAHFIAFYAATAMLLAAFPRRRRVDLAAMAVLGGAAIEVAQQLAGRDAGLGDLAADAAGALAVLAPIWIERLRGAPQVERRRGPAWLRDRPQTVSELGRPPPRPAPPAAG
jgi:VanZ family protein